MKGAGVFTKPTEQLKEEHEAIKIALSILGNVSKKACGWGDNKSGGSWSHIRIY